MLFLMLRQLSVALRAIVTDVNLKDTAVSVIFLVIIYCKLVLTCHCHLLGIISSLISCCRTRNS